MTASGFVFLSDGAACWFIRPADIITIEADGNYTLVTCVERNKPMMVKQTMAKYEAALGPGFFRARRDFIVNLAHVKDIIRAERCLAFVLTNGMEVTMSHKRHRVFLEQNSL